MRILINAGRLTWSTPTTYAQGLVRGLQERGHEVQVAGLGGPLQDSFRVLSPDVYEVHRDFFSFRRFIGFVREFDPDVVHAVGGKDALSVADRVTRAIDKPLVHTVHSWLPEDMVRHLPSGICGVIAVNQDIREHLVNVMNVPKGLIRVIPYGVVEPTAAPCPPLEGRIPVEPSAGSSGGGSSRSSSRSPTACGSSSTRCSSWSRGRVPTRGDCAARRRGSGSRMW